MTIDEGVYLFFGDEIDDHSAYPFDVINLSNRFVQDVKTEYMRWDCSGENDEEEAELIPLNERKFTEYCRKVKTVVFINVKSLVEIELDVLSECVEMVDMFRSLITGNRLFFVIEKWDASFFWTGSSVRRWFNAQFPLKPVEKIYAKPPSVLDLLYEFLETIPNSQDNRLVLKEALLAMPTDDRLFVEDMLSGKKLRDSKGNQEIGARILRALRENKV